jgi:glycosyltransferase involved in cell wall biosynthesis
LRVLHGISPISLQSTRYLSDALQKQGITSSVVIYRSNPLLTGFEDKSLGINTSCYWKYPYYSVKIIAFFLKSLFHYDVFHFHFGYSLLPYNLDLGILKLFRKKTFMEYHGSDIRRKSVFRNNRYYIDEFALSDEISYKKQKRISRHISGIIVHDSELAENLFYFKTKTYQIPLRLDLQHFIPVYPDIAVKTLMIVHSPSNSAIKGTAIIVEAIKTLQRKYNFDFKLLSNLTNSEVMKVFQQADIVIDQLIIGSYGMVSIEAMAFGKPVICYLRETLFREDQIPPICNANIHNIEQKLEELITKPALRKELGFLGRKFVEQYHDSEIIASKAMKIYSGIV